MQLKRQLRTVWSVTVAIVRGVRAPSQGLTITVIVLLLAYLVWSNLIARAQSSVALRQSLAVSSPLFKRVREVPNADARHRRCPARRHFAGGSAEHDFAAVP